MNELNIQELDIKDIIGRHQVRDILNEQARRVESKQYYGERLLATKFETYFVLIDTVIEEFFGKQIQLKTLIKVIYHTYNIDEDYIGMAKKAALWLKSLDGHINALYNELKDGKSWNTNFSLDTHNATVSITLEYLEHVVTLNDVSDFRYRPHYKARYIDYDSESEKQLHALWEKDQKSKEEELINSKYPPYNPALIIKGGLINRISVEKLSRILLSEAGKIRKNVYYGERLLETPHNGFFVRHPLFHSGTEDEVDETRYELKLLIKAYYHTPQFDRNYLGMAELAGIWLEELSTKSAHIIETWNNNRWNTYFYLESHNATVSISISTHAISLWQNSEGDIERRHADKDEQIEKFNVQKKMAEKHRAHGLVYDYNRNKSQPWF